MEKTPETSKVDAEPVNMVPGKIDPPPPVQPKPDAVDEGQSISKNSEKFKLALSHRDGLSLTRNHGSSETLKNTFKLFESCKNMSFQEKNSKAVFLPSTTSKPCGLQKSKKVYNPANTPVQNKKDQPSSGENSDVFLATLLRLQQNSSVLSKKDEVVNVNQDIKASELDEGKKGQGQSKNGPNLNMSMSIPEDSKEDNLELSIRSNQSQVKNTTTTSPKKTKESQDQVINPTHDASSSIEPEVNFWKKKIQEEKNESKALDNKEQAFEKQASKQQDLPDQQDEISKIIQQHNTFMGDEKPRVQESNPKLDDTSSSEEDLDVRNDDIYNLETPHIVSEDQQPQINPNDAQQEEDYLDLEDDSSKILPQVLNQPPSAVKNQNQDDDYLDLGGGDDEAILGEISKDEFNLESENYSLGSKSKNKPKNDDSYDLGSPVLSKNNKQAGDDSFNLGSEKRKDSLGLDDSLGGGDDSFLGGSEKVSEKESNPFGYDEASEAVGNDEFDFKDDSFERERKKKEAKQRDQEAKRRALEEERMIELELEKEAEKLERQRIEMEEEKKREEELKQIKLKEAEQKAAEELKKKMQLDKEDLFFTVIFQLIYLGREECHGSAEYQENHKEGLSSGIKRCP